MINNCDHQYIDILLSMPKLRDQFVRSMARRYGGLCGKILNISLLIKSVSKRYFDIKRCILRREELVSAPLSNAEASFSKQTVCTLQSALIIKTKNFTRARFQPDCSWKMETNSLLLDSTLGVIVLTN
jgi:hypothetical protein